MVGECFFGLQKQLMQAYRYMVGLSSCNAMLPNYLSLTILGDRWLAPAGVLWRLLGLSDTVSTVQPVQPPARAPLN